MSPPPEGTIRTLIYQALGSKVVGTLYNAHMITNSGQSLDALAYATILSGGSMERTSAAGHVVS